MSSTPLYTKFYKDWLTTETGSTTYGAYLKSELQAEYGDDINYNTLYDMLLYSYRYHEICVEDDKEFFNLLYDKIRVYGDYYIEMITAYSTEINFLDGRKTTSTREGTSSRTENNEVSNSSTNQAYRLPNKAINSGKGNLTEQTEGSDNNTQESTGEGEYSETISMIGDVDVVDAKRRYLDLIRNIYKEWVDKCAVCFMGIYS